MDMRKKEKGDTHSKYCSISSMFVYMYNIHDFHSSCETSCLLPTLTVFPFHPNFFKLLQGVSLSIWYHIVGANTFCSSSKNVLEKYANSFNANASVMHPSTLALLDTIALSFFRARSMWYIHRYCTCPPTLASYGKCTR
jgi:hypothetical protein